MKFEKISDEQRRSNLVLSPSALIELNKSPKHYYSTYVLKEKEQTEAMFHGEVLHKLILEPDQFESKFIVSEPKENFLVTIDELKNAILARGGVVPKGKKEEIVKALRSIDSEAYIWEDYIEKLLGSGRRIVTDDLYKRMKRVVGEVKSHDFLSKAISGGCVEQPAWWQHHDGLIINMRLDFFNPAMGLRKMPVIVEVKKCKSASPRAFQRKIYDEGLFIQAAVQVDGVKAITGLEPTFCWAAVESDPPYAVECYAIDQGSLEAGRVVYNRLIRTFLECKETDRWPGYTNGRVNNIALPAYAFDQIEYQSEDELDAHI